MNYGFEDKPSGAARIAGFAFAGLGGAIAGFLAELVVTAFTDTLAAALPGLGGTGRITLYLGLSAVPALVFAGLMRSSRATAPSRFLGGAALLALLVLVSGELSGRIVLERSHQPFYLVPEGAAGSK